MCGASKLVQLWRRLPSIYDYIDPIKHFKAKTYAGKVVFITGASRGIGAETAKQYARAGARVALAARTTKALDAVKQDIKSEIANAEIATFGIDVTNTQEVKDAIVATIATFGRLDIMIANAGKAGEWTQRELSQTISTRNPRNT